MFTISCQEIDNIINSWVYSERDRSVLHRRFVDGVKIERLAEEFDLSVSQIKRILTRGKETLLSKCW